MPSINGPRPPALLPVPGQPVVRPMFRSLGIAASGLAAQRERMETIAQNLANADVTHGADGQPFKRRTAVLESATSQTALYPVKPATPPGIDGTIANPVEPFGSAPFQVPARSDGPRSIEVPVLPSALPSAVTPNGDGQHGVRVAGIAEDQGEGRLVYEPGHPDADANGYVRYPDIDTTQELVNLLDARRIYEANVSVFQTAKSMLRAALDI
jgi:flagellar basal-body rod protein FlgC